MEASRRYYQFGFAKPFWEALVEFAKDDIVFSIDKVLHEINEGDEEDLLRLWANSEFVYYFADSQTSAVVQRYADLMIWAEKQHYNEKALAKFSNDKNADPWAISFAKANDCTLVTHELGRPQRQKSIPIPDVCDAFDIPHCNTFQMLQKIGFKF
jgi:hypothetical protein